MNVPELPVEMVHLIMRYRFVLMMKDSVPGRIKAVEEITQREVKTAQAIHDKCNDVMLAEMEFKNWVLDSAKFIGFWDFRK